MIEALSLINGIMVKCNNKIMMVADPTPIQFTNFLLYRYFVDSDKKRTRTIW